MRKIEMVDLKSQYQKIKPEVDAAIADGEGENAKAKSPPQA